MASSSSSQPVASSTSQQMPPIPIGSDFSFMKYLPLYKAILRGDLMEVKSQVERHGRQAAVEATITSNSDTALHVAVGTGTANHIVEFLLGQMLLYRNSLGNQISLCELRNNNGNTVLSVAAIVGNVKAAEMIMIRKPTLITEENDDRYVPLIEAARHGHKTMVNYLLPLSEVYLHQKDSADDSRLTRVLFVHFLISAGLYDLALSQVQSHQNLAVLELYPDETLLSAIARKSSAFPSGRRLRFYQKAVYIYQRGIAVTGIQRMMTNISSCIERIASFIKKHMPFKLLLYIGLYKNIFGEKKWMHQQKIFLVRHLCKNIISSPDHGKAFSILKQALLLAAALGVHEVVEEIVKSFPYAILFANDENHSAFHLAVINRHEGVFNLLFEMNGHRHLLLVSRDTSGNNILHLAGKLPPQRQLSHIPGAALQMQRELQWFKAVEKVVPPTFREDKDTQEKTPAMVFSEEHQGLVKAGEEWMKGAANSCSVATALIATVVFAAAITVPGGNNGGGLPNFFKKIAFTIFSIADSISLFSSIAAIFLFLSILTARYAEGDFLYALPKRLILGLFMLFLSVTAMMVAFGAIVHLVFTEGEVNWVLVLVIGLAVLPVSVFAYSQFPLLLDLVISTYGPSIFGKPTIDVFYEKDELDVLSDPWTMGPMRPGHPELPMLP